MLLRPLHPPFRRTIAALIVNLVAPPQCRTRDERNRIARDVDRVPLNVSRGPLRAVDLPGNCAANVSEGKDDAKSGSTLVRARDIAAEPRPADRDRDEPASRSWLAREQIIGESPMR